MAGRDFLVGNVTDVVDGETISMTVERTGAASEFPQHFRLHIDGYDPS
jgi:hypothetical protein